MSGSTASTTFGTWGFHVLSGFLEIFLSEHDAQTAVLHGTNAVLPDRRVADT
jgi:hypothetical protein